MNTCINFRFFFLAHFEKKIQLKMPCPPEDDIRDKIELQFFCNAVNSRFRILDWFFKIILGIWQTRLHFSGC